MNGERYPGESLPFEPSTRHAYGRLIAIIERTTYGCMVWQNEAKMLNPFNEGGNPARNDGFGGEWFGAGRASVLSRRPFSARRPGPGVARQ